MLNAWEVSQQLNLFHNDIFGHRNHIGIIPLADIFGGKKEKIPFCFLFGFDFSFQSLAEMLFYFFKLYSKSFEETEKGSTSLMLD